MSLIPGVDTSHYRDPSNCIGGILDDGAQFIIAKVSEGSSLDPVWPETHAAIIRAHAKHDFVDGGYLFAHGDVGANLQAQTFANAFGAAQGRIVAVDAESVWDSPRSTNKRANDPHGNDLRDIANALRALYGPSIPLWLYSRASYMSSIGNPDLGDVYDLNWAAGYIGTGSPPIARMDLARVPVPPPYGGLGKPEMSQFGPVDAGCLHFVDGDCFFGSLAELKALLAPAKPWVPYPDRPRYRLRFNAALEAQARRLAALSIGHGTPAEQAARRDANAAAADAVRALKLGDPGL